MRMMSSRSNGSNSFNNKGDIAVVDFGKFFGFKPHLKEMDLPAGIYYPHFDPDLGLLLHPMDKDGERNQTFSQLVQDRRGATDLLHEITDHAEGPRASMATEFFNAGNDVSYFPMEEYNPGLEQAHNSLIRFLSNKEFYQTRNLDYKRGVLLYGEPGSGKTRYLDQFSQRLVVDYDAIIIRIENADSLKSFLTGLIHVYKATKGRMMMIVIEELSLVASNRELHLNLLSLLDSSFFKENVIFLMTTNNPENIPANLIDRPSRIDDLLEVKAVDNKPEFIPDWYEHITGEKFPESARDANWLEEARKECSAAYLRELFLYAMLNEVELAEAWQHIKERKRIIKENFKESGNKVGFAS